MRTYVSRSTLEQRREGFVIVICPSCQNRYRHDFQIDVAQVAHCGACDERFEPVPARRTYVLVPATPLAPAGMPPVASAPVAVGMHDPLREGKLLDAALAPEFPPVPESDGPHEASRFGPQLTAVLELAIAVVPCGLGAGLAYYFAGSLNQDPFISAILGGVTGLLLGWACVLWIAQAD